MWRRKTFMVELLHEFAEQAGVKFNTEMEPLDKEEQQEVLDIW